MGVVSKWHDFESHKECIYLQPDVVSCRRGEAASKDVFRFLFCAPCVNPPIALVGVDAEMLRSVKSLYIFRVDPPTLIL